MIMNNMRIAIGAKPIEMTRYRNGMIITILVVLMIWLFYRFLLSIAIPGIDWHNTFLPAIQKFWSGQSPYEIQSFYNPPWILLPLIPLAILPENIAFFILFLANLFFFMYTGYKLNGKPLALSIFIFSLPVLNSSLNGNIDGLVSLGIVSPPWIGLFLVLAKPQIGWTIAVFWLLEALHKGGIKKAVRTFMPVSLAFLLSFLIYGLWFIKSVELLEVDWNSSLWPMSIPIGLVLMTISIKKQNLRCAILASPFLSPYISNYSVAILGLFPGSIEIMAVVLSSWIIPFIR